MKQKKKLMKKLLNKKDIKIKLILFDFDGVIINSKKNMEVSWKEVQKKTGSKVKFNKYFNKIGVPFYKILTKINFDKEFKYAKKAYDEASIKNINKIKLFPRAKLILNKLSKEYIIVLITSKSRARTQIILKKFKIKFDHIFCPEDNFKSKPNPEVINYLKKKYKLKKNEIIVIGDSLADKNLAQNAKVKFIFAKYGYFKLRSTNSIKNLTEIGKFI